MSARPARAPDEGTFAPLADQRTLDDLLRLFERRRQEQYAALEATGVDYADEPDVERTFAELADARRTVGVRRRRRPQMP